MGENLFPSKVSPGCIFWIQSSVQTGSHKPCNTRCTFCHGNQLKTGGYGHPAVVLCMDNCADSGCSGKILRIATVSGLSKFIICPLLTKFLQVTSYSNNPPSLEAWAREEASWLKSEEETGRSFAHKMSTPILHDKIFNFKNSQLPNRKMLEIEDHLKLNKQSWIKYKEIYCLPIDMFPSQQNDLRLKEESFKELWKLCGLPGEPSYNG